jgi:small subunit ribosomal protein S6
MNKYELLLILPGTLDEKEAEQKSQEIVDVVKQFSTSTSLTVLGKNRLAYPVKQIRYGYFYTIVFEAEAEKITALHAKLNLRRDLLRFMISHYNVSLSEAQKAAYSDTAPMQPQAMTAAAAIEQQMEAEEKKPEEKKVSAAPVAATPAARKEEPKASMEDIKKKLDKIIDETDIIPGV